MKYDTPACNQFVAIMEVSGLKVKHYEGRFGWVGPSVVVPRGDFQKVKNLTGVDLQHDDMGRDNIVVYPVRSGRLIDDPHKQGAGSQKTKTRR